jgi:copper chaperone
MKTRFKVPDASCGHCRSTIESAVTAIDDVSRAELDLDSKLLSVDHGSSVGVDDIGNAIRRAGYTPETDP